MEALGPWHILIVAAVFVVLFGAKRLPDAARSLGRSARILKSELKDTVDSPATETAAAAEPVVPRQEPMVATVPPPPSSDPLNGNVGSRN